MTLIAAENLGVSYAGKTTLQGVTCHVDAGEIVTIVGPNGSGKSTMIKALIGAIGTDSGTVTRKDKLRIGYVPQRLDLNHTMPMTVGRFMRLTVAQSRARHMELLDSVGVAHLENASMRGLSGGQFQRVLFARALAENPELLILDEPTQGLDQSGTASFYQLIEKARDDLNCGVLMVSHDLHVVFASSDRVLCLNGHICCQGTPSVVSAAPEYRALFGHGTKGTLALYQHGHDHDHDHDHTHDH